MLHEYFATEPVPGWHADLPCLRIPEVQGYARGESDRVLCGGFENAGTSIDPREVTATAALAAHPDWEVLGRFAEAMSAFAPAGVSGSAGLAMHLLESLAGDPSPYVRSLSPDRFIPRDWSWEDARREAQAI